MVSWDRNDNSWNVFPGIGQMSCESSSTTCKISLRSGSHPVMGLCSGYIKTYRDWEGILWWRRIMSRRRHPWVSRGILWLECLVARSFPNEWEGTLWKDLMDACGTPRCDVHELRCARWGLYCAWDRHNHLGILFAACTARLGWCEGVMHIRSWMRNQPREL